MASDKTSDSKFSEWKTQLTTEPDAGIAKITNVYLEREAEWCSDSFVAHAAGGPHEGVTWPVYNAIGEVYPALTREQRDNALHELFSIWDRINWADINGARGVGHTTGIREPLLLADIHIARPTYWPGLDEGEYRISQHDSFEKLQNKLIDNNGNFKPDKVHSDFCVAYALLRSDLCAYGEKYTRAANPSFLERTLQGIIAMRFGRENANNQGIQRLKKLLPESLHEYLEPLRAQGGWADYTKFH